MHGPESALKVDREAGTRCDELYGEEGLAAGGAREPRQPLNRGPDRIDLPSAQDEMMERAAELDAWRLDFWMRRLLFSNFESFVSST